MKNTGQDDSVWSETWAKSSIEVEIQKWDYFGGRPWILKFTPRQGKVLEAGCGLGRYNFYLSHFGIDIIGLDFSEVTISLLNEWKVKHNYNIPFINGDITKLPFENDSLSGYLSFGVVEHFIEGPSLPLAEAFRVLRPGGIAIITTPNHTWSKALNRSKFAIKRLLKILIGKKVKKKEFFQYEYSPNQLKKHVSKSGLFVTEYSGTDFLYTFSEYGIRSNKSEVSLPWYFKFSKFIDTSFFKRFGAQSITISVKKAEKMHCFLCDNLSAGISSLNTYTVPVCKICESTDSATFYLKTQKTYFHKNYLINPLIKKPHEKVCEFCREKYHTHQIFENFGLSKSVCQKCLQKQEVNIELSNKEVSPIWRVIFK